jgi:photosystem II stability/assembly factor-like uncharacterized protein
VASRADSVAAAAPPAALDKKLDASHAASDARNEAAAAAESRQTTAETLAVTPAARAQAAAPRSAIDAIAGSIVSPAASTRWRIVSPRRVDRSTDAGTTWIATDLPAGAQVTAGASPAAGVCWLVGRDGLVLRTVDGATWTRILFPEPLALTSVESSGAESARVIAENGRSFTTNDGGRTWASSGR